jgi:hypothetical protein
MAEAPKASSPAVQGAFHKDGRPMTQEELAEVLGGPLTGVKKVSAPYFYAAGATIMGSGNDFTIIFNRPVPIETAGGGINTTAMVGETVAVVSITPQTAKDLLTMLQINVPAWEAEFGQITTPFTRQLDAQKKS